MSEPKRITIEVDRWELAAILNMHSAHLAKFGADHAEHVHCHDQDDLDYATRTAARVQELLNHARELP